MTAAATVGRVLFAAGVLTAGLVACATVGALAVLAVEWWRNER